MARTAPAEEQLDMALRKLDACHRPATEKSFIFHLLLPRILLGRIIMKFWDPCKVAVGSSDLTTSFNQKSRGAQAFHPEHPCACLVCEVVRPQMFGHLRFFSLVRIVNAEWYLIATDHC